MACINKGTVFYKTLVKGGYDSKEIAKIDLTLESESFKQWYGLGERDSFTNPAIIKDIYLINDKGEQITLNDLLNGVEYEKRKFYKADLTYLDKVNTLLKELKIGIATRISNFRGTEYAERLESLMDNLNKLDEADYLEALSTHTEYILKTVSDLENKFVAYDRTNIAKLNKEELEKREVAFKNFLLQSNSFLETFSKINQLETPKVEGLEVTKLIKLLKDTENRVTELKNRVIVEGEAQVRDKLERLIKNPEVRKGVIDFLSAQVDESKIQTLLDALGDSHVPFLAAVDKFYKLNMANKEDEVKQMQREWREFIKGFNGDFDTFLNRVLETKDGKRTGRFIQEFDEEFYNQLFEYSNRLGTVQKVKGKESKEYIDLLDEYFKWRRSNIEQKYSDKYYDTLNLLTPEARSVKEELDKKRTAIVSKGVEKLTVEDWDTLKEIEAEMKQLKSLLNLDGTPKIGEDLKIAKSVFKYSQEMSKFYYTKGVHQRAFDRARMEAEEKKADMEQWDYLNTSEQYSDRFWEKFNDLIKQYPKTEEIEAVNDEIKQLLIGYRNEKGEVKVEDIPADVKKRLADLQNKKGVLKNELNKTMSASLKRELGDKFKNLVDFIPTGEYLKIFKAKKEALENKEITKEEYDAWFDANHEQDLYTGDITPISMWTTMRPKNKQFIEKKPNNLWKITDIKPEFLNPNYREDASGYAVPKPHWTNEKYSSLSESDSKSLDHITDILHELVEHSKKNIIRQGYIPAIPIDQRNILNTILGKEMAKEEKDFAVKAITETEEIVKFLPFKYIKKLNVKELPQVKEGMTDEEVAEINKEREKLIKENRISHGEALNYDLANTMETFIQTALTNKYKHRMEVDVKLFKEQLKHMKVKVTSAKGTPIYDKIKSTLKGENVEHEVGIAGSNTEKHFNDWLDAVFYEDFELEEGKVADWAAKIQNFTSLRSMGFNVLSGLNNKIIGNISERIESAGGRFYNYKDYRDARKMYFWNITNFLADRNKKESSNFMTAYIKEMDVLISQDELNNKPNGLMATAQHKLKMLKDGAYFMQHLGEHQVQNATLIAMSNSHRIVDGEIMSFNEYFEKKQFNVNEIYKNESLDAALKAIENNQEMKKTLTEEFEKHTKIIDAFEFKNGYVGLKADSGVTRETLHEFRERVIGVNQRLHGIYNTEDAGMIQRYALGRLAIQFRKWMRPGWNKRFGAKFGKRLYNERIRDYEEGMYVTTAKYLASPFVTNWKEYRKAQEGIAYSAYKGVLNGFRDLIFNSKIRWHSMDEIEKANVRKTATEFLFLVTVTALGFLAKSLKGDDDDDKIKNKMLSYVLYQADRLFGELTTFTPIGLVREGNRLFSSPSPVFNTFEDIGKLAGALFLYPFRDEEERLFKTGIYHGKDRVSVYVQDLIPFWNQFIRLQNVNENTQRYGMFR